MIKITDIKGNVSYYEDSAIVETITNDEARREINRLQAAQAAANEAVKEETRTAHKEPEPNFDDVAKIIKQRRQHGSGYSGVISGNLSW